MSLKATQTNPFWLRSDHQAATQWDTCEYLNNRPEFPRAAKYPAAWVLENQMGPNALWLIEWLLQALELKPGMRVLDLGCGKALTRIFMAREFGVRVPRPPAVDETYNSRLRAG